MTWKSSVMVALCPSMRLFSFTIAHIVLPRSLIIVKGLEIAPTDNVSMALATSAGNSAILNRDVRPS